jgi:hypothetical protein
MRGGGRFWRIALAALVAASFAPVVDPARAWTVEEHRVLADSALATVLADWPAGNAAPVREAASPQRGPGAPAFLDTLGFGAICAWSARDDGAMARRHERGRTVLEQLRGLTEARLDSLVSVAAGGDSALFSPDPRHAAARLEGLESENPVACFLQYHLIALRLVRTVGLTFAVTRSRQLRRALVYEAIAQGYLTDAFAAGHLMTPAGARPTGFDPVNLRHAHDYHSRLGAYVLNARGETWQTFGDQLLLWYGPSFSHVFEASITSLRELLLVYAAACDIPLPTALGGWADSVSRAEYSIPWRSLARGWCVTRDPPNLFWGRMPSLVLLPTPAVATWSVRTDELDEHGIRKRHHYPQLRESGGHDPTLDPEDVARLPSRASVTGRMIPDTLFKTDPLALVREHWDFASVRFAQPADPPPSFAGLNAMAGVVRYEEASGGGTDHSLGLGFSPVGETQVFVDRVSADVVLLTPDHGPRPRSTVLKLGASPALPYFGIWREWGLRWLDRVRFEAGHAWTRGAGVPADGNHYAVALESPTIPLGFVYAGLTLRLGYQWTSLDRPRRGLDVRMVLQ